MNVDVHIHSVAAVLIAVLAGVAWGTGHEVVAVTFGMYVLVDHTLAAHRRGEE